MSTNKRSFINANNENVYIEETKDCNNETLCHKQWTNKELVVHLEWVRPKLQIITHFINVLEGSWVKTSYHKFKGWSIQNEWGSSGRWSRFYSKIEYNTENNTLVVISRNVAENWDTGYKTKINNNYFPKIKT